MQEEKRLKPQKRVERKTTCWNYQFMVIITVEKSRKVMLQGRTQSAIATNVMHCNWMSLTQLVQLQKKTGNWKFDRVVSIKIRLHELSWLQLKWEIGIVRLGMWKVNEESGRGKKWYEHETIKLFSQEVIREIVNKNFWLFRSVIHKWEIQ